MSDCILKTVELCKTFKQGSGKINVLQNISLEIERGSFNFIFGKSGSGKSTLLYLLGGLDTPTSGKIFFEKDDISIFTEKRLDIYRNKSIGFVFQFHYLLPDFNALENITMPSKIFGKLTDAKIEYAYELAETLGVSNRLEHYSNQLSGGEQQRIAIARALINKPSIILADEPTGNLDDSTSGEVMNLFKLINEKYNTTIILVTHDRSFSNDYGRIFELNNKGNIL